MRRLFLGLPLHLHFASECEAFLDQVRKVYPQINCARPEQIHLTLHFFGPTPEESIPFIESAADALCARTAPFCLSMGGCGFFFQKERARILWAGVEGDLETLKRLQSTLIGGLGTAGFSSDERPFTPHVTLGRIRKSLSKDEINDFPQMPQTSSRLMEGIILYESVLRPSGSVYEIVKDFRFKG